MKKNKLLYCALLPGAVLVSWIIVMDACRQAKVYKKNSSHADVKDITIASGEALAGRYCQSCHQLPEPALLDAKTWDEGVLPQMGPRLGIVEYNYKRYPNNSSDPNVGKGFYPATPVMSPQEWGDLIAYYTSLSPDTLPPQQRKERLVADTALFAIERPAATPGPPPATCFVRYEPALHQVLTSDIIKHSLNRWDAGLKELPALTITGAVVDMVQDSGGYAACNIGPFAPNNARAGHVDQFSVKGTSFSSAHSPLYDELMRPVNIVNTDLNGDGKDDMVVCEFGYIKGELSWLENKGNRRYQKHVLRSVPGAIHAVVKDYNHDGLPDIWVLFAQGDEGIFLYTNKGNGQFAEQRLLSFPPSYGSTFFELDDFNRDGYPDILYTCGDNGDFSTVLKPYHGVYIFMNDGHNHFSQHYFFPINGCYRAMARDFDGDGLPDIAAIAYFADYRRQPEEGFVLLRNKGGGGSLDFSPYTLPGTEAGRWITMDIADMDGDGRPDILLGNCSVGPSFVKPVNDWKKGPPFIVLRNIIH